MRLQSIIISHGKIKRKKENSRWDLLFLINLGFSVSLVLTCWYVSWESLGSLFLWPRQHHRQLTPSVGWLSCDDQTAILPRKPAGKQRTPNPPNLTLPHSLTHHHSSCQILQSQEPPKNNPASFFFFNLGGIRKIINKNEEINYPHF